MLAGGQKIPTNYLLIGLEGIKYLASSISPTTRRNYYEVLIVSVKLGFKCSRLFQEWVRECTEMQALIFQAQHRSQGRVWTVTMNRFLIESESFYELWNNSPFTSSLCILRKCFFSEFPLFLCSPEELLLMEETLEMRGGGWCWPDLVGLKHRPILTPGSDASRISNTRHETAYEWWI